MGFLQNRFSSFKTQMTEINGVPWEPVKIQEFVFCTLFTSIIAYFANTGLRWVPVLDGANLLFHEAGHPIFGVLSARLMVYGGTLGQLVFPLITTAYFWSHRKTASFYICTFWFLENLWNISVYMADARARILPLVGGDPDGHDWAEILNRWGVLERDIIISGRLRFLVWLGVLYLWFWLLKKYQLKTK